MICKEIIAQLEILKLWLLIVYISCHFYRVYVCSCVCVFMSPCACVQRPEEDVQYPALLLSTLFSVSF